MLEAAAERGWLDRRSAGLEMLTAMALAYLAPRVDRLVCEVGLGGRLDATNALDLGVAVITNVTFDHRQYLGGTIAEIAAEKAGIIKPGSVVITGAEGEALRVVERAASGACAAALWRNKDSLCNEIFGFTDTVC